MIGVVIAGSAEDKHLFLSRLPIILREQLHLPGGFSSTVSCNSNLFLNGSFLEAVAVSTWILDIAFHFHWAGIVWCFPNITWVKQEFMELELEIISVWSYLVRYLTGKRLFIVWPWHNQSWSFSECGLQRVCTPVCFKNARRNCSISEVATVVGKLTSVDLRKRTLEVHGTGQKEILSYWTRQKWRVPSMLFKDYIGIILKACECKCVTPNYFSSPQSDWNRTKGLLSGWICWLAVSLVP